MKFYSRLAGLGICCSIASIANAQIVTGKSDGYFSKVYATDLAGRPLPRYDQECQSKHWSLISTHFYADFRVNTESNNNVAFVRYPQEEFQLSNRGFSVERNFYVFTTTDLPASLKNVGAAEMEFTLDKEMWHAGAKVFFHPVAVALDATNHDCPHEHTPQTTSYLCVLSTY